MVFKSFLLSAVLILVAVSLSFGVIIIDNNGFPFKGIVMGTKTFQNMGLTSDDFKTVKNTLYSWEFTVQGKKYKADLLTFGAIYMTREGQNPVVIGFDVQQYRYKHLAELLDL